MSKRRAEPVPLVDNVYSGQDAPKTIVDRAVDYVRDHRPPGWYTRYDLIEMTGRSHADIKRAEARGILKADGKNPHGWGLYKQETVDRMIDYFKKLQPKMQQLTGVTAPYSEEQGLEGFAMIKAGKTPAEVGEALKCHPAVAHTIAQDYARMSGAVLLSGETVKLLEALPVDGERPIVTEAAVIALVKQAMTKSACGKCGAHDAAFCKLCAQDRADRAVEKERARVRQRAEDEAREAAELERPPEDPPTETEVSDPEALLAAADDDEG